MRVTITGATGLIGASLVASLHEREAQVTVLTRDPAHARARLGEVEALAWDPLSEAAPTQALAGRDAVVHLAGEPVAQRWSAKVKQAIRDSRTIGTGNLIEGLARAQAAEGTGAPHTLISSSAIGYYGDHGEEPLDEDAPPGTISSRRYASSGRPPRRSHTSDWGCARCRCARAWCWIAQGVRSPRCCQRFGWASAARWREAISTCHGSTPRTSSG